MSFASLARYTDQTGRWSAIALGFSIPISVALDNVLLVLILAGWLFGGMYRNKLTVGVYHPVSVAALALFALLAAGTLYGERYPGDATLYLGKYIDLLLIPVFLFLFRDALTRRNALYALAASLSLVLALSYLLKFGVVPKNPLMTGDAASPTVFKLHLTHNILMAFAAFLFAQLALTTTSTREKLWWSALTLLSIVNVTMTVRGATGYLILGGLMLLLGFNRLGWRGLGLAIAGIGTLFTILMFVPGPFQQRANEIQAEIREWQPDRAAQTSTGFRLEFYRNTLAIIAEHPIIGVGTGGFPKAYADKVRGSGMIETRNPHNEYLHIAAQIGMAGLGVLLYLFYRQWRLAAQLASPFECHLARGLVLLMVIGCMFNSLLLDHAEGLLYAWLTGLLFGGLKFKGDGQSVMGDGR